MEKTYLFYDIETTGLNKCFDQVIQFAAVRTDLNLNTIERHEHFVRLNKDVIPNPHAFITHRIPLSKLKSGLTEFEAISRIHSLMNTPGTISLGYNTLGFDDEFLRFSFYRNLLPPYTHQFANGCGRMDLYPMTVMCSLFKRELLTWPENNLKLENIGKQNGFLQGMAHNAMTDVVATVKLARCLRQDRSTWDYLCGFFDKQVDTERCNNILKDTTGFPLGILIDGKLGPDQHYQTAVTPLGGHKIYKNKTLWLRLDHEDLKEANIDNFIEKTWVVNKKLGESALILPMKDRFLKAPLQNKQKEIKEVITWLQTNPALFDKISQHYQNYCYPKITNLDVSAKLYDNDFLSYQDQDTCKKFHAAPHTQKETILEYFNTMDLKELGIRAIGNHNKDLLSAEQREKFDIHCNSVLQGKNDTLDYTGKKRLTPEEAIQIINDLENTTLDEEQQTILRELKVFFGIAKF